LWLTVTLILTGCSPAQPPLGAFNLDEFRGHWLVINYWAIWCKPCIQEIPELNALDELPGVSVLGVNYDGASGDELAQQRDTLGIAFPVLDSDPAAQLGVPRPQVLPTTLVIDPDGNLQNTLLGPQTLESLRAATGQAMVED
jgi:thiol-disulfide isomerase/thioredoxin